MGAASKEVLREKHDAQGLFVSASLMTVIVLWYVYLIGTAYLWVHSFPWTLVTIVTVGGFLFTWLAYYRHELWHNYFPGISNPIFFDLVSYVMFSDPQVYRIAHPAHHKYVHTTKDIEFFCERYDEDPAKRRRQFLLELLLGNMVWEVSTQHRLYREGKADRWEGRKALFKRLALLLAASGVAAMIDPRAGWRVIPVFLMTAYVAAIVTRQNQWIEHLGLRAEGASLARRDMMTRNLPNTSLLNRMWNFYNHNDPRDHVLHHTDPKYNTRGVDGIDLPEGAVYTSIPEHLGRLWAHYRSLCEAPLSVSDSREESAPPASLRN